MNTTGNRSKYFKRFCSMTREERDMYYIYADTDIVIGGKPEFMLELLELLELARENKASMRLQEALTRLHNKLGLTD